MTSRTGTTRRSKAIGLLAFSIVLTVAVALMAFFWGNGGPKGPAGPPGQSGPSVVTSVGGSARGSSENGVTRDNGVVPQPAPIQTVSVAPQPTGGLKPPTPVPSPTSIVPIPSTSSPVIDVGGTVCNLLGVCILK